MVTRRFVVMSSIAGLMAASAVHADYIGAHAKNLGDLGAGVNTYRFYIDFSSPADQLLAISGDEDVSPLYFQSFAGESLRNTTGPFAGTAFEDMPFPGLEAWDSWVTISSDTGPVDAQFSPGFLGGDGTTSVIQGSSFSQADNGGWFDSNPGSPETGEAILIAQLTFGGGTFAFGGTANWVGGDGGDPVASAFFVAAFPAPASFLLLLAPCVRRRRREQ